MKRAPLIALEGIDGTGKGTQARLLTAALREQGLSVELFSFPAYSTTLAGGLVAAYLNGELGEPAAIDSRLTAVLFALDRFELRGALERALDAGSIALCDRYVGSNLAHQVARAPASGKAALRVMIDRLEHEIFGLPRPTIVLYLDMPDALAQQRVLLKAPRGYTKKHLDAHEADRAHLKAALAEYRRQARAKPGWTLIRTVGPRGEERSREAIHEDVMAALVRARILRRPRRRA